MKCRTDRAMTADKSEDHISISTQFRAPETWECVSLLVGRVLIRGVSVKPENMQHGSSPWAKCEGPVGVSRCYCDRPAVTPTWVLTFGGLGLCLTFKAPI